MGFLCLQKNKTKQSYGYGYLKHFDNYLVTYAFYIYNLHALSDKTTQNNARHSVCVICKHFLYHFNLETIEYLLCIVCLEHNTP